MGCQDPPGSPLICPSSHCDDRGFPGGGQPGFRAHLWTRSARSHRPDDLHSVFVETLERGFPARAAPSRINPLRPNTDTHADTPPLAMTGQVGGSDFGGAPQACCPSASQSFSHGVGVSSPVPGTGLFPQGCLGALAAGLGAPGYCCPNLPSSSAPGRGAGTPLLGCSGPKSGQNTGGGLDSSPIRAPRAPVPSLQARLQM